MADDTPPDDDFHSEIPLDGMRTEVRRDGSTYGVKVADDEHIVFLAVVPAGPDGEPPAVVDNQLTRDELGAEIKVGGKPYRVAGWGGVVHVQKKSQSPLR